MVYRHMLYKPALQDLALHSDWLEKAGSLHADREPL